MPTARVPRNLADDGQQRTADSDLQMCGEQMRAAGVVDSARGLVPSGHLCWGFDDRADFAARATECLADGLAAGERIVYVGDGDSSGLRRELAALRGGRQALEAGRADVCVIDEFHRHVGDIVVDPHESVAAQVTAMEKALADGFTGVRAIVDDTSFARTPKQRDALAGLEFLLDRAISVLPITALCAYDVRVVGRAGLDELACMHPLVGRRSPAFRCYADQDSRLVLAGEVDWASDELFTAALDRALSLSEPSGRERVLEVEARGLTFADHRALLALDAAARANRLRLVLHSGPPVLQRIAGLLELTNLVFDSGQDGAD